MNNNILNPLVTFWNQLTVSFTLFFPKLLATIAVFLIGFFIARSIKHLVIQLLEKLRLSAAIKNTPVQYFFDDEVVGQRVEVAIGSLVYWLIMIIVLHTVFSVLGLDSVSLIFEKIIGYLPQVISAVIVLFFGVILAGLVENLVKGAIKTIDGRSARLFGKISSYLIVTIAVLAAISELGIAQDFVAILFVGFVTTLALALGLSFGLGGQHIVRDILESWYEKAKKEKSVQE